MTGAPDEITILGHVYSVTFLPKSRMPKGSLGKVHFVKGTIRICEDLTADGARDTLWHEVKHAVNYHMGLEDESTEEEFVSRGATGERQVLLQNPGLAAWLFFADGA